ncbi:MAG: NAD(P)(+) transhydrogenase (Re/Si-specific) subunit beta [Solirubrobacterales bacterium]|nr:NAD(P)(+) transhydrogenase (Re/Si-specific) subunit beta [Solirubrobacterales bacterium]
MLGLPPEFGRRRRADRSAANRDDSGDEDGVFIKRSLSPGFAGIDNPLFYDEEKTMMLFSDARSGLDEVVEAVKKS